VLPSSALFTVDNFPFNNYVKLIDQEKTWRVEYQPPQRPSKTFFEETCTAIEMIWAQREGRVFVLFGGGLDSEYLMQVLVFLKMNVTPVVVRYTDGRNHETIKRVDAFCDTNNLQRYTFEVDPSSFFQDAATYALASATRCTDYRLLPLYSVASVLDGTVLACMGSPSSVVFNRSLRRFVVREIEQSRSATHAWQGNKIHGTPYALSYTAEQFMAFLNDPITLDFTAQREVSVNNLDHIKSSIYNGQTHFNLGLRKKFDPFEYFTETIDTKRISSLGYDSVCDYDFHTLRFHLRSQIP